MGGKRSGIRWREDVGWEVRCDWCANHTGRTATYWPLTDEFWDRKSMARCRACLRIQKNRRDRARYATDMAWRARRQQGSREYRAVAGDVIALKRRGNVDVSLRAKRRYWLDPERHRATARRYYDSHREEIKEKRKAAYWATRRAA